MATVKANKSKVVIVGAGPVGCVCALAMRKRGHNVVIYESRSDPRQNREGKDSLRSINLAISARGIETFKTLDYGLFERVARNFVPMQGRMVHSVSGEQTSVKYGLNGECINSISRSELNRLLLEEVDRAGVTINFSHKLKSAVLTGQPESVYDTQRGEIKVRSDVIIGCDGSYSKLRYEMQKVCEMDYAQLFIDHYYIEMVVPPASDGGYVFSPNHLHIWPRKDFMFISLANSDGSFTGTLFAPRNLLDSIRTSEEFVKFFSEHFPDALNCIGEEQLAKYYSNPRGKLMNVKCKPYHYRNHAILLGDAAHSMVPFYGQGLNCGLEDVRVLMELMDKYPSQKAFSEYSAVRHDDLTAISDLSMRNYIEMRDSVATLGFAFRKRLDGLLCRILGDRWLPLYTMVSFRPDISYSDAVRRDARQAKILSVVQNVAVIGTFHVFIIGALAGRERIGGLLKTLSAHVYGGFLCLSANVANLKEGLHSHGAAMLKSLESALPNISEAWASILSKTALISSRIQELLEHQLNKLAQAKDLFGAQVRATLSRR